MIPALSVTRKTRSPKTLFAAGEVGVWYDPSDLSTMFSDAAGTTPVTAVETAVGLILDKSKSSQWGPQRNQLSYTEQFNDTYWSKYLATVSANSTTAPDGTSTADTMTLSASDGAVYRTGIAAGTYSLSVYAKANGMSTVSLALSSSGFGRQALFTLSGSGTAGAVANAANGAGTVSGGTSSIVSVGDGWYRCIIENVVSTGANWFVLGGQSASTVYIWGAQLVTGTSALDYQKIGTSFAATLPGNHATQSTDASRPVLSAKYNLLTKTEAFNDSAWTKTNVTVSGSAITAPDGTNTGCSLLETAVLGTHRVTQAATVINGAAYKLSCYIKPNGRDWAIVQIGTGATNGFVFFNVTDGTVGTVGAGASSASISRNSTTGWCLCSLVVTTTATSADFIVEPRAADNGGVYTGDTSKGIYIWGADLRRTNENAGVPAYQRVNTSTDYDTANFPAFLRFDGTDDSLATSAIDFSGTDAVTVFAALRKISDAARGTVVELTATAASNNGSFHLTAPNAASATYAFESKGTSLTDAVASTGVAAPITNVLTAYSDISADQNILRVNGTQADSDTGDQGSGNFSNAALYIGSRGSSSLRFNGRLYGLVVRAATTSSQDIASTEQYLRTASKAY